MDNTANTLFLIHNSVLPSSINHILRRLTAVRYLVRTLICNLSTTDTHFEHVWTGGKNAYNKDPEIDHTSFETLEVKLRDGTKIVFFINPDESDWSVADYTPPDFDSDGNEIREDYCSSETSGPRPPDYDSNGNEIWDD